MPFAYSAFEYGKVRSFEGVVATRPFPMLLVARPGDFGQHDKYSRYLLVAPGKHGADDLVAGFRWQTSQPARTTDLSGRRDHVEITPGSIAVTDSAATVQGR